MRRRYRVLLLVILLFAVLAGWLWWARPTKVDMATYAPADSLLYLEANDPLDVVETVARTAAWKALGGMFGSPAGAPRRDWLQRVVGWTGIGPIQSVILARAQVAVVITDLGTAEEGDTLRVKPEGALLIETHTSEGRIRPPFEQALKTLAEKTYVRPTSRRITLDGAEFSEWISPDGSRQLVGAVVGSLIIVGNSEHSVRNCLAVSSGRRPALKDDSELREMRLQLDAAHALTFGYVPRGNSARLLSVGLPLLLGHSPGDSDFQRLITTGAAKVFGSLAWTSRPYLTGIEDRYLITLQPSIITRLKPVFNPVIAESQIQRILPNDVYSVTSYKFADPAGAWQSLKSSVSSQVDTLSAIIFSTLLKSALLSYGINDPEAFLGTVNGELLTFRWDENDERSLLIAGIRDRTALRELLTKKFDMKLSNTEAGRLDTFQDSQGDFAAILGADNVVMGSLSDVQRYAETQRANVVALTPENLRRMTYFVSARSSASIVTYTNDSDRVRSFISALMLIKGTLTTPSAPLEDVLSALPYSVTKTTLGDRGIERMTRSPLGQFSTLLPLIIPERTVTVENGKEAK